MSAPNDSPLFSVVIACYNYGRFLARAIDSVLAQTFTNYEIIVVDDGSTDETPDVAEHYNEKINYHRQANAGHCAANNKGAELARGEYIYFLDADDELLPSALQTFADAIAQNPAISVLFGGYISVSESGVEKVHRGSDIPDEPEARLRAFITKQVVGLKHGSTVLHHRIFSKLQYPIGLRSNTDIVFLGHVIARFGARGIQQPVVKSHAHADRVRKNSALKAQYSLAAVDILFDPAVIPAELMMLKPLFRRQRLLSLARADYHSRDYLNARARYLLTVREFPHCLLEPKVVRRLLAAMWRSLFARRKIDVR